MKIYHNPRCRKSRETLQLIEKQGIQPEIILYLKTPPTINELKEVLGKLNIKPSQIVRTGEKLYKEAYKGKEIGEEEWIKILVENPVLIERPIVVKGNQAVIGRPPENVNHLF